tara:strand:- start:1024 stop:1239 length:216 start_codon:yes stop_codon:yes gene_type:complete
MQNKQLTPDTIRAQKVSSLFHSKGNSSREKVDVNVLLNRVKFEKKGEIKKNLILTVGVVGALSVTALITII